jgi:hypothetical protein
MVPLVEKLKKKIRRNSSGRVDAFPRPPVSTRHVSLSGGTTTHFLFAEFGTKRAIVFRNKSLVDLRLLKMAVHRKSYPALHARRIYLA